MYTNDSSLQSKFDAWGDEAERQEYARYAFLSKKKKWLANVDKKEDIEISFFSVK